MREFTEQELVRREEAQNIREKGMDPFGHRFERDSYAKDIKEKYKEDAIITITSYGGECTEDFEYYVFYKNNKIIEHKKFTTSPMTTKEDGQTSESKYTKKEYKIDKKLMNELKNIINEAKDKGEHFGTTMNYKIVIDNQTYGIEDQKKIKEMVDTE